MIFKFSLKINFGWEDIGVSTGVLYIDSSGSPNKVYHSYCSLMWVLDFKQQELNNLQRTIGQIYIKEFYFSERSKQTNGTLLTRKLIQHSPKKSVGRRTSTALIIPDILLQNLCGLKGLIKYYWWSSVAVQFIECLLSHAIPREAK